MFGDIGNAYLGAYLAVILSFWFNIRDYKTEWFVFNSNAYAAPGKYARGGDTQ